MLKFTVVFLILAEVLFPADFFFGSPNSDFKKLKLNGISLVKQKDGQYKLELSKRKIPQSEFLLNFENKEANNLRDVFHHYTIESSFYSVEKSNESILGKRIAGFTGKNHFISLKAEKNTLLGKELISEDFYFSLFVKPEIFEGYNTIFSKTYFSRGKKYSLNLEIVKNKLSLNIENLFSFRSKETKSLYLRSPKTINSSKWTHIIIFFKIKSGEVILYEDGIESVRNHFPDLEGEEPQLGIHNNDTTPFIIGQNYYGKLDNFLLSKGSPDFEATSKNYYGLEYDEQNATASQKNGKVFSEVYKTKYSNSFIISLSKKWNIPKDTSSNLFIRISDTPFSQDDTNLQWVSETKISEIKKQSFRYFQWMAVLRSNYSGEKSPSLYSVSLNYKETTPPLSPTGLKITNRNHSDLILCLEWDANKEENVKNEGGYIVHYGFSPEKIAGTIFYKNEKKEFITSTNLCMNNNLIHINSDPSMEKNLPFFEKGKTYYFKVSAFNNKFNQTTSPDQKSSPSKPISFSFESNPLD
ncbi:MAG: hypothetical protein L6Q54_14430 [Leptospiraceae bacterium]|nr:hypothetical protein [Leptospiraceae bacterium]MCK6382429.1 hypothetical protein [Leptospiraceae bacterium]NUM40848.1 hypothetical protein [Leptospiraceae bacterium]